ncbi:DUF3307 domain-containing protein [Gracilibacillus sp. S3-1-1]|uniref:DUF3307 domain-containing protein n=1 Tax=Gracilibacillus pellucidus TaxID=3095368 RepID=A0ACC6M5G7_9BACI|nr:DUF3307 domain-containing protein [Gracilibacillus sp. S3-1-1]MDX8046200.1 DUF3307 domain-containing protein [Gracilibacillus sp. S3-1-1]
MTVLLLLLGHLIADFWLQSDKMVTNKLKNLPKHLFHHMLTTGIALVVVWGYQYEFQHIMTYFILPFAFIIISHFLIDLLKIKLVDTIPRGSTDNLQRLGYFLLDQLIHVVMICLVSIFFFNTKVLYLLDFNKTNDVSWFHSIVFIIIIYILATSVSGHIIKFIIGSLPSKLTNFEGELTVKNQLNAVKTKSLPQTENSFTEEYHYFSYSSPLRSRGKLIGYVERLLVIILTAIGAYQSIAFIIAAKSIARFKQLDDRNWAEYFLLGTLSSILIGLVLGLIVQVVLM